MTPIDRVGTWLDEIHSIVARLDRHLRIMEVCGTHTTAIFRSGVPSLLPSRLELLSGPGCPVCVTSQGEIDRIVAAADQDVVLCTYGDMLRVPGTNGSLQQARANGARVRVVYSAMDVLRLARSRPDQQFVFAAVGFETTCPATAALVIAARQADLENLSVLTSHKRVLPALEALFAQERVQVDALLLPGHVSIVLGSTAYDDLPLRFSMPMAITGFEDWQIIEAIAHLLGAIERSDCSLTNLYPEVVTGAGNVHAQDLMQRVFERSDCEWRGLGSIPRSGLVLREEFAKFDAARRFGIDLMEGREHPGCRCGEIITGELAPPDCALFGRGCSPANPLGPCMVSSEGTCQAWFKYDRASTSTEVTR